MRICNVVRLLSLTVFITNCSLDVSIDEIVADDFLKSTILSTKRGVGDGQTSATVVVALKNSDNSPIANYNPEFDFVDNSGSAVSANGITFSGCTTTNSEGVATCTIKSILVGARRIYFHNVAVELFGQIFFDPPSRNGTFLQVLSAAQVDQDAGGYSVTSNIGSPFAGVKHEEDGYIIMTNTTAGITPVD